MDYESLFDPSHRKEELGDWLGTPIAIPGPTCLFIAWEKVENFVRPLRYPEFCFDGKCNRTRAHRRDHSIRHQRPHTSKFFQQHFANHGFSQWMEKQLTKRFENTQQLLKISQLLKPNRQRMLKKCAIF